MACVDCKLEPVVYDIAIDFDGVIHSYDKGLHDGSIYGDLMPGFQEAYDRWTSMGWKMVVYSCRDAGEIRTWLDHRGIDVPVTRTKPLAKVYVDDKAHHFTDWGYDSFIIEDTVAARDEEFIRTPHGQAHVSDRG